MTPIRRALLSVSNKEGLIDFAQFLHRLNVELLSTGGTASALRAAGLPVRDVAEVTGFPEMLDGRVKTLHPHVHGGILARRDLPAHMDALAQHGIGPIDLVVVTLYPFEETVASGAAPEAIIEQIDIGGPALIRASAKNFGSVTILTDPADYARVTAAMESEGGKTSLELRRELAGKAYARTASYDAAISSWFAEQTHESAARFTISLPRKQALRYGENPHQQAGLYTQSGTAGWGAVSQLQGKELSYNNIQDADAAWELAREFMQPAVVIVKHANPCGVAAAGSVAQAYAKALACDPVSAFGGIIACNRELDEAAARAMSELFVEIILAPSISPAAREVLAAKKNLRLLVPAQWEAPARGVPYVRSVSGGLLVQDHDRTTLDEAALKIVTQKAPTPEQMDDLRFAFTVAKHVKSNAIVLARGQAAIGLGAGQMSRIDSTGLAQRKAQQAGFETEGAALASDAFFPFADNVELAAQMGVRAIIQPGGSVRDAEVIAAADAHGIAMVFTGLRHFRH